ncbi:MAG: hypothetical protein AB7I18_06250 [Candidatus Berkiella sp.]
MSLEQDKLAEFEMQQRLESIPRSKYFPLSRHETLDNVITSLETSIKRLKAFVRFLSLKTIKEYYQWMMEACARYVPGNLATHQSIDERDYSAGENERSLSQKPSKAAKRSGKRLSPTR